MSAVIFGVVLIGGPFDGEPDLWLVSDDAADDLPEQLVAWRCSGRGECNPDCGRPHVVVANAAEEPQRVGVEYTRIDYEVVAWGGFGGQSEGEARYVHAELNLEDVLVTAGMAHA